MNKFVCLHTFLKILCRAEFYFKLICLFYVDCCSLAVFFLFLNRTEMLECLGDTDFLAKLHCIRQACQVKDFFHMS